jgi:hypothetical protein
MTNWLIPVGVALDPLPVVDAVGDNTADELDLLQVSTPTSTGSGGS